VKSLDLSHFKLFFRRIRNTGWGKPCPYLSVSLWRFRKRRVNETSPPYADCLSECSSPFAQQSFVFPFHFLKTWRLKCTEL
jgi:hypothetical protein